jgi:hypothetical protein
MNGMKKFLALVYNNILLWLHSIIKTIRYHFNPISKEMWEKLMAQNYLQFSEIIPDLTEEEIAWITKEIKFLNDPNNDDLPCIFTDEGGLGFDIEINTKEKELWIYAEEYGSVDCVAYFVQEFINEFRPFLTFSMTWARTCSKLRVGEFSGGWMVVTADKIRFGDCCDAILREIKNIEKEPYEF